ncbi:nuclear pore complex protein Nup214 isoform X3 [Ixodes scapularis]|uniref:nuclear pore complex protein Nup214 isoform X3 n=1 Tax=Ixodes scapularis TaxID=6945 RepID=UPI001C380DE3|nr:nuclear pore complex protein Nup214 isoform X3 [Ixodes scapularis]
MASGPGSTTPNPNFLFHPCRTISVTLDNESVAADAIGLLAASSRFGLLFAGCTQGVKIYRLEDVQNCDAEEGPGSKQPAGHCPFRALPTTGPTLLVALSADDLTLAVGVARDGMPVVDMYDVRGFALQVIETRPIATVRLGSKPGVGLRDFAWNPVVCEMFAACLTDGTVANYELAGEGLRILGTLPATVGGTCLAWSPKGKQLVVGKQNGGLSQFKPNMAEAKALTPPTIFENPVSVISVAWLAPTVFAAVYAPSSQTTDSQTSFVIVGFSKTSPVTYTNFGEPCFKTGDFPSERFWLYHLPEWGILVCNSRNSIETSVLGCKSADKMNWELWELDSHGRAEVPLKNNEEAFPLGQAIIFSAQREIIGKLEKWPPMPILALMATSGGLSPFHMKNLTKEVPLLVKPPETLDPQGQRRPMANPPQPQQQRPTQVVPPVASSGFPSLGLGGSAMAAPLTSVVSSLQSNVSSVNVAPLPQFGPPGTMATPAFSFSSPVGAPSTTVTSFSSSNSFMPLNPTASSAPAAAPSTIFSIPASSATAFSFGSSANSVFSFGSSSNNAFSFGSTTAALAPKTTSVMQPTAVATVAAPVPAFPAAPGTMSTLAPSAPGSNAAATMATTSALPVLPGAPIATTTVPAVPANTAFGFGGVAPAPVTSSMPPGFKLVSKSALEVPAAAAPPPVLMPVQAPHEPESPRVGEAGAVAETKRNLHDVGSQPVPSLGDGASPAQQPQKQEPSKDAIMAAMKDEIAEFGRELGAFKEKARCAFVPPGTEAEMRVLKRDGMELEGACEELKKGVEKTNEEVHALGVLVLETFAMLEEGRTQELRNRDPRFAGLLRGRALDPGTAQRLAEVRRLRQYLEAQLAEVHARLDLDWQEHLARRKNRKLSTLPSGEAVYRAALSCRKVTAALSAEVDSLASRVKGLKLRGSRGQAHERPRWAQATSGSLTREDEVSALADTLLSANLSVVSSDAERVPSKSPKTMLSPEKQSRLAEFLSQRSPVPVRARTIDKLSESRLMSRLAVVLNRSVAKEQEREAPARAPQQETGLPTLMPAQAPAATSTLAVKPAPIPDAKGFVTAVATPKPQEGFGPGFLTSTPLSQPELVMGGIGSGVPPARTATSDQAKMPASRVIEVSLQPRPDTGAPPQLPPGVTLTPLSTTAAPPEISAAAVTNVVTKPLATRTETTITSKEAGTAAFLPTMSQPEFKFQLPGVVSSLSATTASSSPLTSIPVYSFGMPSSAPVSSTVAPPASFGFVKPTAGVTVPTTFKIGEPSTAKPGFVVVKPSTTAPGFAPLPAAASASSASSAARKQMEEVLKGSGVGEAKYEEITPPSTPPPGHPDEEEDSVGSNEKDSDSPNSSLVAGSATAPAPAPVSSVFSFATTTSGATGFPVSTSVGSSSFKLNFGQGTGASKSLFGNVSASTPGTTTSAAASFSFTAALSAQRESAPTAVVASKAKDVPTDKPLPVTPVATLGLNLSPSGPSALKPPVTSSVGTRASSAQESGTSPFQPVPVFGSQAADASSAAATDAVATTHATEHLAPQTQPVAAKPIATETFGKVTSSTTAPATTTMAPSVFTSIPPQTSAVTSPAAASTADVAPKITATTDGSSAVTSPVVAGPAVASTASVFGQGSGSVFATASKTTPFGQALSPPVPQPQEATSLAGPTTVAPVFSQAQPAVPSALPFGQQSTTTMPSSLFGSTAVSSPTTAFGQATPFGQTTTSATPASSVPSPFGQAPSSAAPAPPLFGQTTAATTATTTTATSAAATPFWKPVASAASPLFGGSATSTATTPFGMATGAAPSAFGQAGAFSFGQSPGAAVSASSPFGNMMAAVPASSAGTSLFGQKTSFGMGQTSTSLLGGSQGQPSLFCGQSTAPAFGQPQTTGGFGQQPQDQQAAGSGSGLFATSGPGFLSGLGSKPASDTSNKNVFGGSSSFGASGQASGLFGNRGASSFGASAFGGGTATSGGGAFSGGGSFSLGGGVSVAQTGFGAFQQQQTPPKPAAFGGAPAFGGSPTFGGPPQFGGSPTFGSSPGFGASPFGASQSPQQQQQQLPQAQQPTGFSAFGNVEGPTFGALAAQGSPTQQQQQQPQGTLGFGSAFGSPPSFGAAPGFGDQSAQNSPSAFSQWRQ